MSRLIGTARLAAPTVTKVSTGEQHAAKRPAERRERATERRTRTTRVQRRTVHPLVLATALRAANGDASRLLIESETSVLVR